MQVEDWKNKLTSTFGPGDQWRAWWSRPTLPRSGQQDFDLILHIWIQVPQFVGGGVHYMRLCPVPWRGAVLYLFQDDGSIANDAVGIGFDPKVCGTNRKKLGRSNGGGWSWGERMELISDGQIQTLTFRVQYIKHVAQSHVWL